MKIALIGNHFGLPDEGVKNVVNNIAKLLSKRHAILQLYVENFLSLKFWNNLKIFCPDIIHYFPGPSIKSFPIVKLASLLTKKKTPTVMSALQPNFFLLNRVYMSILKPNLILAQSYESERRFNKLGCSTEFLPNGVDTHRFKPVNDKIKSNLREKYGIPKDKFVILHVGHIKFKRNIQVLTELQNGDNQVVIVGSSSTLIDWKLLNYLRRSGCIVWNSFIPRIEEIYALSDCYVFPCFDLSCSIESPLSVFEAMACNLPVICARLNALKRIFIEGDGLFFIDNEVEISELVDKIKSEAINIRIREKVLQYSWENIVMRLEKIYNRIISGSLNK
jgi:glycosyltransferase involved in cell wall biosynthesis